MLQSPAPRKQRCYLIVHGISCTSDFAHSCGYGLGIATPGAIAPTTGLLKNSNSTVLNGTPLDRDLEARLGRQIRMENDANCLALSEAVDGAAADAQVVFGVILGTGVGGGVVVNGKSMSAATRSPANGAIIRSPGPVPMNYPEPHAIAGSAAASNPSCRVPASPAITAHAAAKRERPLRLPKLPPPAIRSPRNASTSIRTGWRGVWLRSSTYSILTRLCLGAASPT
jgi:ROK family protein